MLNLFRNKKENSKVQTAREYWQERVNRNKQKAAVLGIDHKELNRSSFLEQGCKYKITFKGM